MAAIRTQLISELVLIFSWYVTGGGGCILRSKPNLEHIYMVLLSRSDDETRDEVYVVNETNKNWCQSPSSLI